MGATTPSTHFNHSMSKFMPSFSNLDARHGGKSLTVRSIQPTHLVRPRNAVPLFPVICRLFALLLVVTPTAVFAGERDNDRGKDQERGHAIDPTGVWLQPIVEQVILLTFNQDGTFLADFAGESAFVPNGTPPLNTLTTPSHGVWQKTGATTFAATSFAIIYDDKGSFLALAKNVFSGVLTDSNHLALTSVSSGQFNLNGDRIGEGGSLGTANWVRLRLEFP